MPAVAQNQWKDHAVIRLKPDGEPIELPARSQIVTESWNRVTAVPHVVYMPEVDRVLMLLSCDYPGSPWVHFAMVLFSDDRGATWSEPAYVHTDAQGNPACGLGHGLTNLGGGRMMLYSCHPPARWFSDDYGATWGDTVPVEPAPNGRDVDGLGPGSGGQRSTVGSGNAADGNRLLGRRRDHGLAGLRQIQRGRRPNVDRRPSRTGVRRRQRGLPCSSGKRRYRRHLPDGPSRSAQTSSVRSL